MKKLATAATGALTLTILTVSSLAVQGQDQRHTMVNTFALRRIERRLNLTGSQKAEIKQILKTEAPALQDLAQRLKNQNQELLAKGTCDRQCTQQFVAEHSATLADALAERVKLRAEILQVLNPEQKRKLEQMRADFDATAIKRLSTLGDAI